ncbi:MAG: class I SAM-dependent methyltransferase [Parcubacteria group bacterium]|jgi:SAM-dependent methyltransferase
MEIKNKYEQKDWDKYYFDERKAHIKPKSGFFLFYDIYLCDSIIKKYIPKYNGSDIQQPKICEIGSGDGKLVKKMATLLNHKPFGIEYSEEGVKIAQKEGVETILGDAFDKSLLEKYHESFDVVYSYGFVEHIIPPQKAVDIHLSLLKKGGYFFVQIPRLKGFNHLKFKLFRPDLLALHNLKIMEQEELENVCKRDDIEEIFCKNYGTFKMRLPVAQKNIFWYVFKFISKLEYIISPLFRIIFGQSGFETRLFSPSVIFIGRKIK